VRGKNADFLNVKSGGNFGQFVLFISTGTSVLANAILEAN